MTELAEPKYTLIAYKPSKEGFLRGGYLEGVEPSDLVHKEGLNLAQLEDAMVELDDQGYEIVLVAPTVEMPEALEWDLNERVGVRVDARTKVKTEARTKAIMAANRKACGRA